MSDSLVRPDKELADIAIAVRIDFHSPRRNQQAFQRCPSDYSRHLWVQGRHTYFAAEVLPASHRPSDCSRLVVERIHK